MIDRATKWFEVVPIRDITTQCVIDKLSYHWISHFGVPHELVTDRGTQFMSLDFGQFLRRMGILHRPTTAYHPQCNGLVERFHRVLKAALRSQQNDSWYKQMPLILLSLRNANSRSTGTSPAKQVLRTPLRLPGEIFTPAFVEQPAISPSPTYVNNAFVPASLADATHVWLRQEVKRSTLQRPYSVPYEVISRTPKTMVLKINNSDITVSMDRVKPVYTAVKRPTRHVTFAF